MNDKNACDFTYLATLIATELTKNMSIKDICDLKTLLTQVCCTISTIISLKLSK